jgi:PiT family inorganic phosphate transporter
VLLDAILFTGLLFGAYMAWNIGANDVANAMGTSVGSRALTLGRAVLVAAVFEFAGAVLVGAPVTETVKGGLVNLDRLPRPEVFMMVMLAALLAAGLWLQFATWKGLPVSTTHSIVGGVAGAGVAAAGIHGVAWGKLAYIGASWVLSPFAGGLLGFFMFRFLSRFIINSRIPRLRVRRASPWLAGIVAVILFLSMLYKGLKNLHLDLPLPVALPVAVGLGTLVGLLTLVLVRRTPVGNSRSSFNYVERHFRWLQVMTACYVAFAHGANDVANAVGPLAGIWSTWSSGHVEGRVGVPVWILALGGVGIVVGLGTWGYRVMETIGKKITELTPSRGFCAEFAAATTVLVCSKLGLPISTTHTLVGSVIGVGLARGLAALDARVVRDIASAWVVTLPAAFLLGALLCLGMTAAFL